MYVIIRISIDRWLILKGDTEAFKVRRALGKK